MDGIFTYRGNVKRVETKDCYGDSSIKTIEIFDKKNRNIQTERINKEGKAIFKQETFYDDENDILTGNSRRIGRKKEVIEQFIQNSKNEFYYNRIKIFRDGVLVEEKVKYNPPILKKTIRKSEKEKIELHFRLDGILNSLDYSIYNSKHLLIEKYSFSRKNHKEIEPIPKPLAKKYPIITKSLDFFNLSITGERISDEPNLYFFDHLVLKQYHNDSPRENRKFIVCFEDTREENFDLFENEYEVFDLFGNLTERGSEGCGDGNFSLPSGAAYENKYNEDGLLCEVYSKGNSRTKYTYDKAKKIRSKRTETFFYDAYGEKEPDTVDSIEEVEFDEFGNATELIRRYFNRKTSGFDIGSKFSRLIEYWK